MAERPFRKIELASRGASARGCAEAVTMGWNGKTDFSAIPERKSTRLQVDRKKEKTR